MKTKPYGVCYSALGLLMHKINWTLNEDCDVCASIFNKAVNFTKLMSVIINL